MTTLLLDTTGTVMRLALRHESEWLVRVATPVDSQRTHSALLIPAVQHALHEARLTPQALSQIVVNSGPGSFTGIRTSVSLAKTFGQFVPGCQMIALNTMAIEAMAWRLTQPDDIQANFQGASVGVLLNARNQTAYGASFQFDAHQQVLLRAEPSWQPLSEALAREQHDGNPILISNIADLPPSVQVQSACSDEDLWFDAMAACLTHPALHEQQTWQTLAPLYLQPPRATIKKPVSKNFVIAN